MLSDNDCDFIVFFCFKNSCLTDSDVQVAISIMKLMHFSVKINEE